jgi:hypothetical protein
MVRRLCKWGGVVNRREANKEAKRMYCMSGEYFLAFMDDDWKRYADEEGWTDKEVAMVENYYNRTCARVADWLGV